jgi:feruloyl esterase
MKKKSILFLLIVALLLVTASLIQAQLTCDELTSLRLPNATILSATEVPATDILPQHCFAVGVIQKEIGFEVKLPMEWNGKFIMFGNGGFAGSIQNDGSAGLVRGYATAATDTGHTGEHAIDGSWALNNMKRQINFGFRAVHLATVIAKRIIGAYYDEDIAYSYFQGCSRGGGQAMIESQRFPGDFDGIIAGAPAYNWNGFGMGFIWNQQAMYPNPEDLENATVPNSKLGMLDAEVLDSCDAIDGLMDGLITDPRNCTFDPAIDLPICPGDIDAPDCFTAAQVAAIARVYNGPSNSKGQIHPGFPPGAENAFLGWDMWITEGHDILGAFFGIDDIPNAQYGFGEDIMRYFVYNDPNYDFRDFDFETDVHDTARAAAILNATNPNLKPFKVHGGKMIMYNGWCDHAITPLGTIKYYEQVINRMGGRNKVENFFRLFLAPGMLHCSGGPGPNVVDWLTALELWVEEDVPPNFILAEGENPYRTRPLCPYPEVAVWDGVGDPNLADSFSCQEP